MRNLCIYLSLYLYVHAGNWDFTDNSLFLGLKWSWRLIRAILMFV